MKNSVFILILAMLFSAITIEVLALGHESIPNPIDNQTDPPQGTKIDLFGDLAYGYGPDIVEAYYTQNMVVVCFHQNLGYVSILLIGGVNTIYESTVNTAVQQTVYIPITGTPSGTYTLILNNANGGFEGDFEN